MEDIIKKIKKCCDVLLFLSIGERSADAYGKFYDAGARGVLFRFETSNPEIYKKLHPTSVFEERINHLRFMCKQGYLIATGSLIGLPGQTEEDLVNDILLTKSLGADMYSFGPFIPHPDTPLADTKKTDVSTILKIIALSRLADSNAKIVVTTALETLGMENRKAGLLAGANSLMINVTPMKYRKLYSIYPNRATLKTEKSIADASNLLYSLGRAPTDLGI